MSSFVKKFTYNELSELEDTAKNTTIFREKMSLKSHITIEEYLKAIKIEMQINSQE